MDDNTRVVLLALIAGIPAALASIIGAVMAYLAQRRAAVKVQEVKEDLAHNTEITEQKAMVAEKKINRLTTVAVATHTLAADTHDLANSGHGSLLKVNAELARWKADREPSAENIKAADEAQRVYEAHEASQAVAGIQSAPRPPEEKNP